jgi:hypothetical protein
MLSIWLTDIWLEDESRLPDGRERPFLPPLLFLAVSHAGRKNLGTAEIADNDTGSPTLDDRQTPDISLQHLVHGVVKGFVGKRRERIGRARLQHRERA